jgi:hypothetical protein
LATDLCRFREPCASSIPQCLPSHQDARRRTLSAYSESVASFSPTRSLRIDEITFWSSRTSVAIKKCRNTIEEMVTFAKRTHTGACLDKCTQIDRFGGMTWQLLLTETYSRSPTFLGSLLGPAAPYPSDASKSARLPVWAILKPSPPSPSSSCEPGEPSPRRGSCLTLARRLSLILTHLTSITVCGGTTNRQISSNFHRLCLAMHFMSNVVMSEEAVVVRPGALGR